MLIFDNLVHISADCLSLLLSISDIKLSRCRAMRSSVYLVRELQSSPTSQQNRANFFSLFYNKDTNLTKSGGACNTRGGRWGQEKKLKIREQTESDTEIER